MVVNKTNKKTQNSKNSKSKTELINEKLDRILENEKLILKNEEKILGEEKKLEELELEEIALEKKDLAEDTKNEKTEEEILQEMQKIERDMHDRRVKTLKKVTKRDLFKGFVGAFIGTVGHFAFIKGFHLAEEATFTIGRSTILYLIALFIIIVMLYYTGFRKVEKHFVLKFMPMRALILYAVSILAVVIVNLLFGYIDVLHLHVEHIYKIIAANIILAVIGAGTADLIGGAGEH